jgi:diguanylate cyclase (GGDEF)-like protein
LLNVSALGAFILTRFERDAVLRQALSPLLSLTNAERALVWIGSEGDLEGLLARDTANAGKRKSSDAGFLVVSNGEEEDVPARIEDIHALALEVMRSGVRLCRDRTICVPLVLSTPGSEAEDESGGGPGRVLQETLGVLVIEREPGAAPIDPAIVEALDQTARGYAALVAGTIAALRAQTDRLTGLLNRGVFLRLLPEMLHGAVSGSRPLALISMDIKCLDRLNRLAGRITGDEVLRLVGRILRGKLRATDLAARTGGDEFSVAMLGCDEDSATTAGVRLREAFDAEIVRGKLPPVAVNLGLVISPDHGTDAGELFHRANQALSASKRLGSGRIETWNEDHRTIREMADRLEGLITGEPAED